MQEVGTGQSTVLGISPHPILENPSQFGNLSSPSPIADRLGSLAKRSAIAMNDWIHHTLAHLSTSLQQLATPSRESLVDTGLATLALRFPVLYLNSSHPHNVFNGTTSTRIKMPYPFTLPLHLRSTRSLKTPHIEHLARQVVSQRSRIGDGHGLMAVEG